MTELRPRGNEAPLLVEHLHAAVGAIGYEQPSLRIERQRMGIVQLSLARSGATPCLDERAVLREFQDPVILSRARRAVSVGDEDVAARRYDHRRRGEKRILSLGADARLSERQQQLAVAIELEDLRALA